MTFFANLKTKIKTEPFKYIILLLALLMFISLFFVKNNIRKTDNSRSDQQPSNELMVFVQDGCLHCEHAEEFLAINAGKYKDINVVFYNLKNRDAQVLLFKNISRLDIPQDGLGTPIFIMGDEYIVGFGENEKSNLIQLLKEKKIRRAGSE